MKYPIGVQSFDILREGGYAYVDKTRYVYDLVTNGRIYFLGRPRRFGKSLLVSTLDCYFSGRKELFDGLAIATLEKEWVKHPVFRFDFNGMDYTQAGQLESALHLSLQRWERVYHIDANQYPANLSLGLRFKELLRQAYEQTGQRCVVLIDEYDKPILDVLDVNAKIKNAEGEVELLENHHRNVLKGFYSTFKAADEYLRFVLLTGVTKFSQVSVFSGFNQPYDISMDERYEALCGITKEELHALFAKPIEKLALSYDMSVEAMKEELARRYDGYHFSDKMGEIFNPFSILNVFAQNKLSDYWFATGTPTYLIRLLNHNNVQMDELTGRYYDQSMFVDYKADVEQPLPMLYQSGYLTFKAVNRRLNTYLLDFPNNEVRQGFLTLVAANYLRPKEEPVSNWLVNSISKLDVGATEPFMEELKAFLVSIPYDAHQGYGLNDRAAEKHFQYTFYLLLRLLGVYALKVEQRQSKGRADCILELYDYVYIFEFILNGTPEEALAQIEEMAYAAPYAADKRKVVSVGVNFSSESGTVDGWKIR